MIDMTIIDSHVIYNKTYEQADHLVPKTEENIKFSFFTTKEKSVYCMGVFS